MQGENARLASELAVSQASLAAVQAGTGDKDKLVAARQRNGDWKRSWQLRKEAELIRTS
jgi:hypothetical protein